MKMVRNYTAHIDSKKRITIRSGLYQYYNVKEYENGCILLEPRELSTPKGISAEALRDIDESIANLDKGKVSKPIDLSEFL